MGSRKLFHYTITKPPMQSKKKIKIKEIETIVTVVESLLKSSVSSLFVKLTYMVFENSQKCDVQAGQCIGFSQ